MAQDVRDSLYKILTSQLNAAVDQKNKKEIADAYYELARFENENFNFSNKSFEYFTNAKQYYTAIQDSNRIYIVTRDLGNQYFQAGLYTEAIANYQEALNYFSSKDNLYQVTNLNYDLSKAYEGQGDLEQQLYYLNNALALNKSLEDEELEIKYLFDKIRSYETLNELDSAILVAIEALKLSNDLNNRDFIGYSLYHIGYLSKEKGQLKEAIKYLNKSLEFTKYRPYDNRRKLVLKQLSDAYSAVDMHETAYNYSKQYASLNDSILSKSRMESFGDVAIKYQSNEISTDIKKLEIEKTNVEEKNVRQRRAMYFLTGGLLMLLALIYYIINFYRQKIQAEEIISQQKEEIAQQKIRELEDNIQISSMQSMLEGQELERERIAKDLHDSLGGLLSTIKLQFDSVKTKVQDVEDLKEYKNAHKMLDSAVGEVRSISQNLQPGSLMKLGLVPALKDLFNRFDDEIYPEVDFQHYDLPEKLDNMIALTTYRLIQELLNNTIKHAKANEVLIQINHEEKDITITYEDDGVGFDLNAAVRGMGLENLKSRVNYLKGDIQFDTAPGKGISVVIHLPNHIKKGSLATHKEVQNG